MEVLEIQSSSAISKITFNKEESLVGVSFTYNPNKEYLFSCEQDLDKIKAELIGAESIGKLVNSFRKDGTFKVVEV